MHFLAGAEGKLLLCRPSGSRRRHFGFPAFSAIGDDGGARSCSLQPRARFV